MNLTLYVDNDNVIEISSLYDSVSASYINDATVTVTLTDEDGTEVTGETWPLSLSYAATSNGTYRATLSSSLNIVAGGFYYANISAEGGSGQTGSWKKDVVARTRN